MTYLNNFIHNWWFVLRPNLSQTIGKSDYRCICVPYEFRSNAKAINQYRIHITVFLITPHNDVLCRVALRDVAFSVRCVLNTYM